MFNDISCYVYIYIYIYIYTYIYIYIYAYTYIDTYICVKSKKQAYTSSRTNDFTGAQAEPRESAALAPIYN